MTNIQPSLLEPPPVAEPGTNGTGKKRGKSAPTLTTTQQLGSLIKSARDTMRKDKGPGMDTDLGRLPLLTWVMFLKFLDDIDTIRAEEAILSGEPFRPTLDAPYRWSDWAGDPQGITGDDLLSFINDREIDDPLRREDKQGKTLRVPGLFAYLRGLQDAAHGSSRRDVVSKVFQELACPMRSGYLLREVINKVSGIHFTSQEELFTLGTLYESLLKEMRDAAGQNGEFYTPRAVVRFMVTVIHPCLGETVLDPACGTGGFLVEAYRHLERQCQTVEDRETLQSGSLFGGEAKPLPYLLSQMNLLLHGLEAPQIDPGNSLRFALTDIRDRDRVDVILANPPFGGEEEKGIQNNFPNDKRTGETALLFLQLIMRKLRRPGSPSSPSSLTPPSLTGKGDGGLGSYGRAAVVVPNGTLFGDGVCARIKEQLLTEFNLHTIVRLPNGVFAPYTGIPSNLLFFDRSGPTEHVWYYEQPLPEGRKNYTKTAPLQFEEFADCLAWWEHREENDRAWRVPASEILANGCNLDRKNPRAAADLAHLPPEELVASVLAKEERIVEILAEIKAALAGAGA